MLDSYTLEIMTADRVNEYASFFYYRARGLANSTGEKFDPANFSFSNGHRLTACFDHEGEIAGFMLAHCGRAYLDPKKRIYKQHVLWAREGTPAAKMLLDEFVDFGKRHADHILTTVASFTNIKPRSLERLGFKPVETLYRIEVDPDERRRLEEQG